MTFSQSGSQYLSMYVTGRAATDNPGTMRAPVLVQSGLTNYHGDLLGTNNPIGPVSGINVDSDGSFWAVNQYADLETFTNWSTAIAHFSIPTATTPVQGVSISQTAFTGSSIASGSGGAGGAGGMGSDFGRNHGVNGAGGNGGLAQGGTVFLSAKTAQSAVLNTVTITSSQATAGAGGAGAINNVGGLTVYGYWKPAFDGVGGKNFSVYGWDGYGSNGGNGGSVEGVGIAAVNYALALTATSLTNGVGAGGSGGNGGGASAVVPYSWDGGNGGAGGAVQGGGVYLSNKAAATTSLGLSWSGGSASNYTLKAGAGGNGGNAGASTTANRRSNVAGGAGGAGGSAQGGGIYVFAGSNSVNNVSLSSLNLLDDQLTAGGGGVAAPATTAWAAAAATPKAAGSSTLASTPPAARTVA